jgi:hypothetical protein
MAAREPLTQRKDHVFRENEMTFVYRFKSCICIAQGEVAQLHLKINKMRLSQFTIGHQNIS